jgi:FixJ family two-component response regulator
MSKPLRLLVVEESDAEVAPLVRELRRHGYAPKAVRVDNADAMRDTLQRQAWDVVIANHALPDFSSQDALRVLQESGLDLPLIIVSDTTGEEAAVTAMKAGAHDYVMKAHLIRLGPAVERELQEAQVRRQRREAERGLAAQQAVTRIRAEADTLGDAGANILQAIAKDGEWEAGEIWTVDRQSDVLRCFELWHTAGKPLGEFATRTRPLTFARGVGLPGGWHRRQARRPGEHPRRQRERGLA